MEELKPRYPNAYIVNLSGGSDPIQVDEDELQAVIQAIKTGQPAIVRQGLFNPSYYVSIVQDKKRVSQIREDIGRIMDHNKRDMEYDGGKNQRPYPTLTPLKSIFENTKIGQQIEERRLKELKGGN